MDNLLVKVHEGMKVYDNAQKEVGKVDYVQFSDENPRSPVAKTADVSPTVRDDDRDNVFKDIARVFAGDEVPEALRTRLLREGFIRVDAKGLFKADRYILPSQIQSVST